MKKLLAVVLTLGLVQTLSSPANAADGSVSASVRQEKDWGLMVGLGSPYPSVLGFTLAHHLDNKWRASVGYSEIEAVTSLSFSSTGLQAKTAKATTIDFGGEYLFMEDQFRPVLGVHAAYLEMSGDGSISIQGFNKSGTHLYSNLGIDWISEGGYQLGAGFNLAFVGANGTSFYMNTGWYF